jgi:PleD family two-component response regulator
MPRQRNFTAFSPRARWNGNCTLLSCERDVTAGIGVVQRSGRHEGSRSEGEMQIGVETAKAVDQRRVFVIDEDEITRTALQFMLHDEIETHELTSPEEAYEKGVDWLKPHVLLLGVSFLKERGSRLVGELLEKFPGTRILIVTDKSDEQTALEGLKAGAHGALVKPLTLETVRKKVDTVLGRDGGAELVQLGGLK